MVSTKRKIFLEAFLLTVLIFLIGFLAGIMFEEKRVDIIQEYYAESEISLMDILALNNFANLNTAGCDELVQSNLAFANRVYEEAKILEEYEKAGRLTDNMDVQHRKYDVMRTFLWINTLKTDEVCEGKNIHTLVYVYNFQSDDLTEKATNSVWSKVLGDLKEKHGSDVLLIPIAVDSNITALDSMLQTYNIEKYPSLIIDNQYVIGELSSVEDIEAYLN